MTSLIKGECKRVDCRVDVEKLPYDENWSVIDMVYYKVCKCGHGTVFWVCKICGEFMLEFSPRIDVDEEQHILYNHLDFIMGLHGGVFLNNCKKFESYEIKRLMDAYKKKVGINMDIYQIEIYLNEFMLLELFPQILYLDVNREIFSRIDLDKIDFDFCYLKKYDHEFRLIADRGNFMRLMSGFVREIKNNLHEIRCRMCESIYDCMPTMEIIRCHFMKGCSLNKTLFIEKVNRWG